MRQLAVVAISLAVAGCAPQPYRDTPQARFTGVLEVRWVRNDYFLFLPNRDAPFTLVRANGAKLQPGPMYTDGGSIPRFLWGVEGYSPWGYAPAYIVHDWLFEAHHCGYEPDDKHTFEESVEVMAEGLKAVMEAAPEVRNYFVFDTVVRSVASPIARRLWDQGSCKAPPFELTAVPETAAPGELLMTIRYE